MTPLLLLLALLAQAAPVLARPYHPETIASLATSRHTHVELVGRVTLVKREADGDWHLRLSDGVRFIVAEIIPTLQPFDSRSGTILPFGPPPPLGSCVRVRGIRRFDNETGHGWYEVHPIEFLEVVPCS